MLSPDLFAAVVPLKITTSLFITEIMAANITGSYGRNDNKVRLKTEARKKTGVHLQLCTEKLAEFSHLQLSESVTVSFAS